MGFKSGAYATVWKTDPRTNTRTDLQISTSRKDKTTGEYETDFSGFVSVFGTEPAMRAAKLKEKDRIRLGDVEVASRYDAARNTKFYNFKIFSFEQVDSKFSNGDAPYQQNRPMQQQNGYNARPASQPSASQGNNPYDGDTTFMDDLPF